jgi:hypothetical protein
VIIKQLDQYPTNQETAKYKEEFHPIREPDSWETRVRFFQYIAMTHHNKNDGQGPHEIKSENTLLIVRMESKNVYYPLE